VSALPGPLVDASWLAAHIGDPDVVVADVRWYIDGRSGEAAYDAGHLPGAVFVALDADLSGSPSAGPGRHPLSTPEHFAAAMMRCGISDTSAVVAYDDAGGSIAARLWWMLTATGHAAAVLNGGISGWMGELSLDLPSRRDGAPFTAVPWPLDCVADAVAVDAFRRDPAFVVIDARSAERFRGEPSPVDRRPGHIPGAVSAPWTENVNPATGRMRTPDELRSRFDRLNPQGRVVVSQCGSGVTACHNLLALEVATLPRGRLYPGSWSDWSADPDRPAATGAA
jgi:thiosulfate/3-mercaptopyruvate sulfurtransferase